MKITFITSHFPPENTAGANRIEAFADITSEKHEVSVVTLTEKGQAKFITDPLQKDYSVQFITQSNFSSSNFLKRMIYELYYSLRLLHTARKHKSEVYIISIPYLGLLLLSSIFIRKSVFDVRDMVWDYINKTSYFDQVIASSLKKLALYNLKKSKFILITNEYSKRKLSHELPRKRIEVFPNGVSRDRFQKLKTIKIKNDIPTVSYIGNIGIAQNLGTLIGCACNLPDIKFNFIGEGNDYIELKEKVKTKGTNNVHFYGKLNWADIIQYYESSTILFAKLDPNFESAVPSKIYEYLATGLPILYVGKGAVAELAESFENFYISEDNSECIQDMILTIIDNWKLSSRNIEIIKNKYIREEMYSGLSNFLNE